VAISHLCVEAIPIHPRSPPPRENLVASRVTDCCRSAYPHVANIYTAPFRMRRFHQEKISLEISNSKVTCVVPLKYAGLTKHQDDFLQELSNTARHIQVTVKAEHGQAYFILEGVRQTRGSIAGTYCSWGRYRNMQ